MLKKSEIAHLWDRYHTSLKELENFESHTMEKKSDIIITLRDSVTEMVKAGVLNIRMDQVSAYVKNKLYDRGIMFSVSYWSELFHDSQKREYNKKSSETHQHKWEKVAKTKRGLWERCVTCGVNRIDGIIQEPSLKENNIQPEKVIEVKTPEGIEFDLLTYAKAISQNNIKIINMIRQKTNINYTAIEKQIRNKSSDSKEQRIEDIKKQSAKRIENFKKAVKNPKKLESEMKKIIEIQLKALKRFDDRASITYFEKIMAYYAVTMGYDRNDIARMLNITTKHMKVNVLEQSATNMYLDTLKWLERCPNPDCGVNLKDTLEIVIHNRGKPNLPASIDPEPLLPTGYQREVILLKAENKRLRRRLEKNNK